MKFRLTAFLLAVVLLVGVGQVWALPASGPVHHWTFDETGGNVAADSVSGNDGTLNNWGPSEPRWVDGVVGGALDFGDTDNYVITDSRVAPMIFRSRLSTGEGLFGKSSGLLQQQEDCTGRSAKG